MVLPAFDSDKEDAYESLKLSGSMEKRKTPSIFTQVLIGIACATVQMGIGTILGFSGVTLPQLLHPSSDMSLIKNFTIDFGLDGNFSDYIDVIPTDGEPLMTENEAAFFSSAAMLGAAIGSSFSGTLMVVLGPRTTLLIGLPLTLLAWVIVSATPSIPLLLIARLFQGIAMGTMGLAACLFVVEISHFSIRGPLSASLDLARNIGVLLMFGVGASEIWWRYQALIVGLITTIPNFILLLFMENSPRWLAVKGRFDECYTALLFYRGSSYDIKEEYDNIVEVARNNSQNKSGIVSQFKFMMQPGILKVVFFCLLYAVAAQLTGTFAIIAYAVPILKDAVPSLNPYIGTVLMGLFKSIGGVSFMLTSNRMGRAITYFIASMTCFLSLVILGIHMYLQSLFLAPEWTWWVPIISILAFTAAVAVAIPVAGLQVSELLPLNCRAVAYGLVDISFYGSAFTVSVTFPYLRNVLNPYGVMWFYAASSFIFAWMPVFCLPETLGRHLEDIEKSLLGYSKKPSSYGAA